MGNKSSKSKGTANSAPVTARSNNSIPNEVGSRSKSLKPVSTGNLNAGSTKSKDGLNEGETGLGEWFHGKITRPEAERLLMVIGQEGAFLVRKNNSGDLVLSVKDAFESVKHYQIQTNKETGEYYITITRSFRTVPELVTFYKQESENICSLLTLPCPNDLLPLEAKTKFELDRGLINLTKELGAGQFGAVYYGTYKNKYKVAVKTLKTNTMPTHLFLMEVLFMLKTNHPNIVNLRGICTENMPMLIVLDFAPNGDLKNYLQKKKDSEVPFSWIEKIGLARQCALGMQHLFHLGIAHRDLAARNVLVGKNDLCQIADFGLACFIGETKSNHDMILQNVRHTSLVPTKWTAPEVLKKGAKALTPKADVWSFGVLCMEIATDGATPYPQIDKKLIYDSLMGGHRMDMPEGCPSDWYKLMLDCWAGEPEERPNFDKIVTEFDKIQCKK